MALAWREAGLQEDRGSEITDTIQEAEAAEVLWEGQLPVHFPRQPKGQVKYARKVNTFPKQWHLRTTE